MLKHLDHVNVRTSNLAEMTQWYERVLGMRAGPRPAFPFGGAWLYVSDQPAIHLVDTSETEVASKVTQLEHMAFTGESHTRFTEHLRASDIDFNEFSIDDPVVAMTQVHIKDPDGNHLHIDFPLVT